MSAQTRDVLDAARAVEADADRELSLARLSNPAAIAWLEEEFDRTWEVVGSLPSRRGHNVAWMLGRASSTYVRPMAEVLEDECLGATCSLCDETPLADCWQPTLASTADQFHVAPTQPPPSGAAVQAAVLRMFAAMDRAAAGVLPSDLFVEWRNPQPWRRPAPTPVREVIGFDGARRGNDLSHVILDELVTDGVVEARTYWLRHPVTAEPERVTLLATATPAGLVARALAETTAPDHLVDPASRVPGVIVVPTTEQALAAPWAPTRRPSRPAPTPRTGPPLTGRRW